MEGNGREREERKSMGEEVGSSCTKVCFVFYNELADRRKIGEEKSGEMDRVKGQERRRERKAKMQREKERKSRRLEVEQLGREDWIEERRGRRREKGGGPVREGESLRGESKGTKM